jgi:hypothetical protein
MTSNGDVFRWEDGDSYLRKYHEAREQKAQADWFDPGPMFGGDQTAPVKREDSYADAAREQLGQRSEPGAWALGAEQAHADYERRQAEAQLTVRLAEKAGEDVPDELRRLATTPSAGLQVEAMLEARGEQRAKALRNASTPLQGHNDGTFPGISDPAELAFLRERTLAALPQVRRHRQLAEGQPAPRRRGLFGRAK